LSLASQLSFFYSSTGTVLLSSTATSTSTTTGALVVPGGVGISKDLYVGGTIYGTIDETSLSGILASTSTDAMNVLINNSVSATTYYIALTEQKDGNYSPLDADTNVYYDTETQTLTSTKFNTLGATNSTSTTTGDIVVAGGIGVGKDLYVGGTVTGGGIRSTTTSTPPPNPTVGDIWYNTADDTFYRYTSDGVTNAWLDYAGPAVGNAVNGSNVAASLIPTSSGVYDLGSNTNRFRTLYVTSSTIDIGGVALSATGGSLAVGGVALATTASVAASVAVGGGPKITSVQLTTGSSYTVTTATAISTSGGYILINGTGFVATPQVTIGAQLATSIGFVSATQLQVQVPAQAAGTYPVYVTNSDGGVAINVPGLTYNQSPVWATGSTLTPGVNGNAISIQLSATDDGSVTYSVSSGSSLPSGLSLSSGGLLSGTVTGLSVETTYNFSIDAIDSYTQKVTQSFSITITVGDAYFPYVSLLLNGNGTNGAQNNTFLDGSTNNFTITRNGNTTQGTFSPYGANWSNYFGTAQHKLSTTGMTAFGSDFTLELWIFPTSFNDYNTIFDSRGGDGDANGVVLGLNSAAKVYIYTNGGFLLTTTTAISLNTWTHIALVRSGSGSGNVKVYINGVADATTATYTTSFTSTAPSIGDDWNTRGFLQYFGYLSNLRAVTSALYTSTFTPSTTPLTTISGTVLLTCQSNRFKDNSSSNLTITVTGSPTIQRFSPFSPSAVYSTSTIGGSGYFDGAGDSLQAPSGASISGTGDFTAECWIYPTTIPGSYNIIVCSDTSGGLTMFGLNSNGTIFMGRSLIDVQATTSNSLIYNTWNHIAISRSSGTVRLFINGVQGYSGSITTNYNAGTVRLGTDGGGSSLPYTGYISNFRIISNSAVYTSNFTPPTAPVTAISGTSLLLNYTNAGIIDNTMINNLETVGNAQISTVQSKFGGSSMYFDGTGDYLKSVPSAGNILRAGNFTIEFWLYPSDTNSAYRALVSSENYANTTGGWSLYQYGTSIEFWISPGVSVTINATSAITASTWQHLALCRASGTLRLFINGTSVASVSNSTELTGQEIWIGDNNSGSYFYNGYIDDLRITKGYARYTTTFTPPASALLGQ